MLVSGDADLYSTSYLFLRLFFDSRGRSSILLATKVRLDYYPFLSQPVYASAGDYSGCHLDVCPAVRFGESVLCLIKNAVLTEVPLLCDFVCSICRGECLRYGRRGGFSTYVLTIVAKDSSRITTILSCFRKILSAVRALAFVHTYFTQHQDSGILILRTYALFERSRRILCFLAVLWVVGIGVAVVSQEDAFFAQC